VVIQAPSSAPCAAAEKFAVAEPAATAPDNAIIRSQDRPGPIRRENLDETLSLKIEQLGRIFHVLLAETRSGDAAARRINVVGAGNCK
jgi:hypothetical protein